MSKTKYPATMVVHWASGPVNCCDEHGRQLITLGKFLGSHTFATKLEAPQVANLTNCKKLYELSGWIDDDLPFYCHGFVYRTMEIDTSDYHQHYPAYDLSYLLRKLPRFITSEQEHGVLTLWSGEKGWYCGYEEDGEVLETELMRFEALADTPEDAAALLAIKLFEQGILTAPSPDKASNES